MDNPTALPSPASREQAAEAQAVYTRFNLAERIEHILFLLSFTLLGITGLAQRYAETPIGLAVLEFFGGITGTRLVHHTAAFVMMWVSVYHIIAVLYRIYVLRVSWTMMPVIDDFKHLLHDISYFLGFRKHKAYYGRYNYGEKLEYLAVVWGTLIMALTGFMMWNPITTTKYLPGEVIPAAKVAHSAEAVLAVLSIIIWHMYHVHVKLFNKSMFTGKMTEQEMEEEHPAELAEIKSGQGWKRPELRSVAQAADALRSGGNCPGIGFEWRNHVVCKRRARHGDHDHPTRRDRRSLCARHAHPAPDPGL